MSRSKKKNPYVNFCRSGIMKDWKKEMARKLRRKPISEDEVLPSPKECGSSWTSPSDGGMFYNEPKGYRK